MLHDMVTFCTIMQNKCNLYLNALDFNYWAFKNGSGKIEHEIRSLKGF